MIGSPQEIAVDLLMSTLSTFITQAAIEISPAQLERLRTALTAGKSMHLGLAVGPQGLDIVGYSEGDDGEPQIFLELSDRRDKWIAWSADLAGRPEVTP